MIFIFLTLSVVFIVLQNGLFIENISTPNLTIKQLYIKWNESLDISAREILLKKKDTEDAKKLDLKKISSQLSKLSNYYNIFEKISINNISYDGMSASFKYVRGEDGYLKVYSPHFKLKSSLNFEEHLLNIQINELRDDIRDINIDGNVILDIDKHVATVKLNVNIHNEIDLTLFSYINEQNVFYTARANKDIKSISYTIELLKLHPAVNYWADKAIRFSSVSLVDVHGWASFDDLDNAYKNVYAHAIGKDLKYKYNQNLDDIHTTTTDVIFQNGSLDIYPRQAYTYKSKLGTSWIRIDFTTPQEQLTLKLLFDGKLDKDTLGILEAYKIKLPFLQNSGVTNVNLTIGVNLQTIDVYAKGKFFTKEANFRYLGLDIDIFDAHINLNNYDVNIKNMRAQYKDIATTTVGVVYDAKKAKGNIDFLVDKVHFSDLDLNLDTNKSKLKIQYSIAPNNDIISANPSLWNFQGFSFNAQSVEIPFDLKTLILNVPPTVVDSKKVAKAHVYGSVDLYTQVYKFDANITDIFLDNISVVPSKLPTIHMDYNTSLVLSTKERTFFKVNSFDSFLNKTRLEIKNDKLNLEETYINIDNIVKTKFSVDYSLKEKLGKIKTNRLRVKTKTLGDLYLERYDTNFDISLKDKEFTLSSSDLGIFFVYTDANWKLNVNSLLRLERNSKLLQKYNITKGKASLYKNKKDKNIQIRSTIYSSNKVMVKNNIPLAKYIVRGDIEKNTNLISLNINENAMVSIDKDISIKVKNIGINMNAIADIVNAKGGDLKNYSSAHVSLNAKNTYLYISENRHALSDNIDLDYLNKVLTAKLVYNEGSANVKFKNGVFHIEGEKFDDTFMENLFSLAKFKDGTLKFTISGTPNKYDGLFTVDNTTLIDYKVLNNILAFVNTVPALVTFSTPSYSNTGLQVKTAYMKFTSIDNLFTISDVFLDSDELDILGSGTTSFIDNTIDLKLNLRTDLGSSVSKVPLVGYILMDDDSLSTTLSITGALNNPDVTSLAARDIIVAPLNILMRAVTLPFYLINSIDNNETQKEEKEKDEWEDLDKE